MADLNHHHFDYLLPSKSLLRMQEVADVLRVSDTTIEALIDKGQLHPSSFGDQTAGAVNGFRENLGTAAESAAAVVSGTLNSALRSTGDILYNLATGSMNFRDAWKAATLEVGKAFASLAAEMVAKMIWRATVERTLTALGLTTLLTAEGAKTAATITAETARTGVVVGAAATNTAAVTGEAATIAGATGIAGVFRSIMELGPIAGPVVFGTAIAGMLALINSVANFADGGLVRGPGTGTSDSIPARLSNGEFVVRAAAVNRYGHDFFAAANAGALDVAAPLSVGSLPAMQEGAPNGGGNFDPAALVEAVAMKMKHTTIVVSSEREATRISKRSQAAGDVVDIVRAHKAEIFRQGP